LGRCIKHKPVTARSTIQRDRCGSKCRRRRERVRTRACGDTLKIRCKGIGPQRDAVGSVGQLKRLNPLIRSKSVSTTTCASVVTCTVSVPLPPTIEALLRTVAVATWIKSAPEPPRSVLPPVKAGSPRPATSLLPSVEPVASIVILAFDVV